MKISLTLILLSLIVFLSSCATNINKNEYTDKIKLEINTNNKNKEKIIETVLLDNIQTEINFESKGGYYIEDEILNSKLKFFCNSFIRDQRNLLEKVVFENNNKEKKVLIIYTKEFESLYKELSKKYPNEYYFLINEENIESQVKNILHVDKSLLKNKKFSNLDTELKIIHEPRIRNDISKIYFLSGYDLGKTIVPLFRNYAFEKSFYSTTEVFHEANDMKKLVDFENMLTPTTNNMMNNISRGNKISIKNQIEMTLIRDYILIEKVYQNNLFKDEMVPDSGNLKIKKGSCVNRKLSLWKISTDLI